MTGKDLLKRLRVLGFFQLRQRGSHVVVECGECVSVVPLHAGEDIGKGLLRKIERDLERASAKAGSTGGDL